MTAWIVSKTLVVVLLLGLSSSPPSAAAAAASIVSAYGSNSPANNHNHHQQHWSLRNSVPSGSDTESSITNSNDNDLVSIVSDLLSRVQSLEISQEELKVAIQDQAKTIVELESKLDQAHALHRFLEGDTDCLPEFVETSQGGRCDFKYVVRFQNNTIFNDDVFFNENVEFDRDADCMPVAFTDEHNIKTCIMKDNFTYISDVEFWNTTTFKNDSEVFFEKDVTFKDNVKFTYDVTFEDDVYIQNDHKDTYFEVNGKVKVEFEPDHTIHINKDTEFAKDVTIDGDLDVDGHTYLDSTTVDGDLSVKDELTVDGEIYAKGGITSKSDVTIEYGKLYVERDGIHVVGYSEFANDVHIVEDLSVRDLEVRRNKIYAGDLTVKGALNAQKTLTVQGAVKAEAALTVDGPFTANGGSTIWLGQTLNAGANPAARRLAGEARGLQSRVGLTVNGNLEVDGSGTFSGVLTGGSLETIPPTRPPAEGQPVTTISSTELVDMLGSYEGVVRIGTLETDKIDTGVLDVATEAHVGEDKILTTADVDTIADQPTTTETVNECTCDAQMIRDAINGQDITLGTLTAQTVQVRGGYMIWDPVNEVYVPFGGGGGGGCGCGSDDISAMGFITQSEVECSCSEAAEDPSE